MKDLDFFLILTLEAAARVSRLLYSHFTALFAPPPPPALQRSRQTTRVAQLGLPLLRRRAPRSRQLPLLPL